MKDLTKGKKLLLFITICLTNVAVMADFVIIPVANDMFMTYPSEAVTNFILSGPQLLQCLGGFVGGFLMARLGKRKLLIASFALFAVSAIVLNFFPDMMPVAVLRSVGGFCIGIIYATAMAVITDVYDDPVKLGTMMGIYNAAMAGVGVVLSALSGFLAVGNWTNVFIVYWITVPVLVMVLLFIPETSSGADQAAGEDEGRSFVGNPVLALACYFMFHLMFGVLNFLNSVYIAEKGMGGSDVAGMVWAIVTVASMVCALIFGKMFEKMGRNYSLLPWAALAIGFFILFVSDNLILSTAALIVVGGLYAGIQAFYITWIPLVTKPEKRGQFMGFVVVVTGLGLSLSTYFASFLQGILQTDTVSGIMPVLGAIATVMFVIDFLISRKDIKAMKAKTESSVEEPTEEKSA